MLTKVKKLGAIEIENCKITRTPVVRVPISLGIVEKTQVAAQQKH